MKKKVFQMYFLEVNTQEQIRKELEISKGSVTKIIKECREQIAKCELSDEADLGPFIDIIVEAPMRKKAEYRRRVVTEIHIKIIEKMVVANEHEKKRLRQAGFYSRSNLYLAFIRELRRYNKLLHNMQQEKNKKISAEFRSEAHQKEEQNNLSHCENFAKICDEYELPADFEESRNQELHVISSDTFYKLARMAKKKYNLLPKSKLSDDLDIEEEDLEEEDETVIKLEYAESAYTPKREIPSQFISILDELEMIDPVDRRKK